MMGTLFSKFGKYPENIPEKTKKPWLVISTDLNGVDQTFQVVDSNPDRTIGFIFLTLEIYNDQ